jgi:hypothetical protein
MYDKFDKLQVTLTNVFRTQLAMMGSTLEERLEARLDKRLAERLQLQTEQLREVIKAAAEAPPGALDGFDLKFVSLDDDVDDEFLDFEGELSGR